MSHFDAWYECADCKKIIGGWISNSIIVAITPTGCRAINPNEIELLEELKTLCSLCAKKRKIKTQTQIVCRTCSVDVKLFYSHKYLKIFDPNDQPDFFARTDTLLADYGGSGWCSHECFQKFYRRVGREISPSEIFRFKIHK